MVTEKTKGNKKYFICEQCGFAYKTKDMADKCERFCIKNKSCSIEITKHSIKI